MLIVPPATPSAALLTKIATRPSAIAAAAAEPADTSQRRRATCAPPRRTCSTARSNCSPEAGEAAGADARRQRHVARVRVLDGGSAPFALASPAGPAVAVEHIKT